MKMIQLLYRSQFKYLMVAISQQKDTAHQNQFNNIFVFSVTAAKDFTLKSLVGLQSRNKWQSEMASAFLICE